MNKGEQSEVTNKLRCAIKRKLADISDIVDDELPEYIMILVANQRSKLQIEKDLSLFLGNDTVNFTSWLWDVLNSLNVGCKTSISTHPRNDSSVSNRKDIETDEDAIVLDCDPDEQEKDFFSHDDTNDSSLSKTSARCSTSDILEKVKKETSELKSRQTKLSDRVKGKKDLQLPGKKVQKLNSTKLVKEPLTSKVVPVKKRLIASADEYDPAKPNYAFKAKPSIPRNYGGPAALQANKLLLKAVDDATKSILDGKNLEDFYKPTPIKILISKQIQDDIPHKENTVLNNLPPAEEIEQNIQPLRTGAFHKALHSNKGVVSKLFSTRKDVNYMTSPPSINEDCNAFLTRENITFLKCKKNPFQIGEPEFYSDVSQTSDFNEQRYCNVFMEENCMNSPVLPVNNRTICLTTVPVMSDRQEFKASKFSSTPEQHVKEIRPKSPHFIVTLEGVKLTSFKRKLDDNSIESMDEDEDDNMLEEALHDDIAPSKKMKINERCKYWPSCKNSDHCSYYHPTVPCKCFPDCKFGDKCLYIHPNCKFDALCSRKDCPFTHVSKRKLTLATVPSRMVPMKSSKSRSVCKYFPQCTAKSCPYVHPKLCRYGTSCRLPVCLYSHFPLPSRSQLKWKA